MAEHNVELRDANDRKAEQEKLLQRLLAERVAEMEGLDVLLVDARGRNAELGDTVANLRGDVQTGLDDSARMKTEILRLRNDLAKFKQIADLDQAQIDRLIEAQDQLKAGLATYLADNKLGIKREQQRLVLQLSDQILFASGSADIRPQGIEVLRAVGGIIAARIGQLEVQIGGHTDNIPISSGSGFLTSNWALSAARAVTVVRFLEVEVGIDAKRLSAAGYGEHRPVANNASAAGRALNRRIEIVLVPR